MKCGYVLARTFVNRFRLQANRPFARTADRKSRITNSMWDKLDELEQSLEPFDDEQQPVSIFDCSSIESRPYTDDINAEERNTAH